MPEPLEAITGQLKGLMGVSFSPIPSSPAEEALRGMGREGEPSAQIIKTEAPASSNPVDSLLNRIAAIMRDMLSKEKATVAAPESFGQKTAKTGILGPVAEKTTGPLTEEPSAPVSTGEKFGGLTVTPSVSGLPGSPLPPPPPGPAPAPGSALEILEQALRRK